MDGWVHAGQLLNGASRRTTNIEVSSVGVGIGPFKRTMYPWSSISDVTIDGPSSKTSRVTATRLVTLGVFALAAKKSTSETVAIITLTSGQIITVMFTKKSEPEVRAIFTPHLGRISKLAEPAATVNFSPISSESRIKQLKDLSELLEKGLINNQEFLDLKSEILNDSAMPNEPAVIDSVMPMETTHTEDTAEYSPVYDARNYQKGLQYIKDMLLPGERLVGEIEGLYVINPTRHRFGCIVVTNQHLHFRGGKLVASFEKQITESFNLSSIQAPFFTANGGLIPGSEHFGDSARIAFSYNQKIEVFWLLRQAPRQHDENVKFNASFISAHQQAHIRDDVGGHTNES